MKKRPVATPSPVRREKRKSGLLARLLLLIASVICLVVIVVIGIVLINLPDRDLDATAKKWQSRVETVNASGDRGATDQGAALWALDAPASINAATIGRGIADIYMERTRAQIAVGDWALKPFYPPDPLLLPLELGCIDKASACVSNALSHSAMVRDLAQKRSTLLSRIDAIDAGGFTELTPPPEPHAPNAQFATLIAGHSLSLALAAVDVGDGQLAEGSERLERMARVPRRMLAGCKTLACKLVAAGMLRRADLVYSELMSQTTAIDTLAPSFERISTPMTPAELDLTMPLAFELLLARHLDANLAHPAITGGASFKESVAVRAAPLFLKENATFNRQVELADLEAPLATLNAADFASNQAAITAAFAHRAEQIGATSLASLYNPLGRVLASGLPSIENGAAQLHDLEGLQAGVRAKSQLLLQHVHLADAQAVLNQKAAGMVDPYSGAALQFDTASSQLLIPQRGPRRCHSCASASTNDASCPRGTKPVDRVQHAGRQGVSGQ